MTAEMGTTSRSINTKGWIAGAIIILVVFATAAGLWFHYHP
ncbi:MAG: hypothetical protein WA761_00185 [Thermoplasmata archaeon]